MLEFPSRPAFWQLRGHRVGGDGDTGYGVCDVQSKGQMVKFSSSRGQFKLISVGEREEGERD